MRLPTTPVTTLLREVRDEVCQRFRGGRVIVAIDGRDPSGATAFSDSLAEVFGEQDLAAFRTSTRAFLAPRTDGGARIADVRVETGVDAYDFETMRRVLIDPFRDGAQTSSTTGFQLAAWDADRGAPVESRWVTAPADAVLLIDAFPIESAEVRPFWDFSIWLETSADAVASVPAAASIVINNLDPARPARVRSER